MWINWYPDENPHFVYGFCQHYDPGLADFGDYDAARSTTFHPGVIGDPPRYSNALVEGIGDPCVRMEAMGIDPTQFTGHHGEFKAFAIGNLDDDPDLAVYSIDSTRRIETHADD